MHGTQGVLETGMHGPGIYQVGHSQLLDPSQPLKKRMFNQFEKLGRRNGDEPVYWIVDDLSFDMASLLQRFVIIL
jgi:hypothetical protein